MAGSLGNSLLLIAALVTTSPGADPPTAATSQAPGACCAVNSAAGDTREFHADSFSGFFSKLFDTSDYPPRWYCGSWTLETGWLHIISDAAIFGAYFAIPVVLLFFLLRRRDLPFPKIIWLFATFILACGIGHLVEATLFWWPYYRFSGLVKAFTAIVSWGTVLVLIRLMPQVLKLPSLAILGQQLKNTNERLDCALEAGNIGVWEWLVDENQFQPDARAAQIHDMDETPAQRTLETFLARIHPDDQAKVHEAVSRCTKFGTPYSVDYRVLLPDGSPRYIESHGKALTINEGNVKQVVGVCTDVTELKVYHAEVEKLSLVASSTRHSVVITNREGETEWVNEAFVQMTGFSREEVQGKKPGNLLQGPQTDPDCVARIRKAVRNGEHIAVEILNYHKNGRPYWISLEIEPVFDDNGSLRNFIATQIDITERLRRTEKLVQATEAAELANRAKSQFLANMSHEIRTPLNAIIGFTDVLLRERGRIPQAERVEHLQTIRSSGQHLLELINDVLDLSKIEADQLTVESIVCSPHKIISETVSALRVGAMEKGIQLDYRWESPIPKAILTDPSRLKQLLMNLVGNAVKFTDQGSVLIVARVNRQTPKPDLLIEVRDTGIGIPAEKLESVFKPFVQADETVTRKYGGTGLGLAIGKKIASALGGNLTASSTVGQGSTFVVRIPTGDLQGIEELDPSQLPGADVNEAAPAASNLEGMHVLVVDDGDTNRRLLRLLLERSGAKVRMAENGQVALDMTETIEFDVVLMDMHMPVLDGYTATARMRDRGYSGPIIALTANAMKGDREKCELAGCSGYLSKPIDTEELFRTLAGHAQVPLPEKQPVLASGPIEEFSSRPIRSLLPTDDEELRGIVAEFIDTLEDKISQMQAAWDNADTDELATLAHWLKGAGGTVGFSCFTSPAISLEQYARAGNMAEAESTIESLRGLRQRLVL